MLTIKLVSKAHGKHIAEAVYGGLDADHLAMLGVLVMEVGEWQLFGAALLLGAARTNGQLTVILEGLTEGSEELRALSESLAHE